MTHFRILFWSLLITTSLFFCPITGQNKKIIPVSPNASPEATALLQFLYDLSGKYTLTGQHSYPITHGRNYNFAAEYIGKTPVIFSTDLGFSEAGDNDSYLSRPQIVQDAIEFHKKGAIITLCWHAVPPTADEPVTFRPLPDANPDSLASVQGQLTDQQFKDVLTPGTKLYNKWCAQVDSVAIYLKKLQEAHVPILWRPYHEMNGNWFWWGGRQGEYGTVRLYKQLFDRLVNYHKLSNLIWVWNIDRPNKPEMQLSNYYPGNNHLDILSLDVYGRDFNKTYYDSLLILSKGKPLAFGEVGNPPASEILNDQPRWCYWATWAGMVRNTTVKDYDLLMQNPRILNLEDSAYRSAIAPYREVCTLDPLPIIKEVPMDFSGTWIFNEEKSQLDHFGAGNLPYKLEITQDGVYIDVSRTIVLEYNEDKISVDHWTTDGTVCISDFWNVPLLTTINWSVDYDTLQVESKATFSMGDRKFETTSHESWIIRKNGKELCIQQTSNSFWGERYIEMIFDKRWHD